MNGRRPVAHLRRPAPIPSSSAPDRAFIGAIAAGFAAAVLLYMIRDILLPFVAAAIVAYVLTPLVDLLTKRTHLPRAGVATLVFLVLLALAIVVLTFALPAVVASAAAFASDAPAIVARLTQELTHGHAINVLGERMTPAQISASAIGDLRNLLRNGGAVLFAATGLAALFGVFLGWVLLFYFLVGANMIGDGLFALVPPTRRPLALKVWRRIDGLLRRYFIGVGLVVLYASAAAYLGLGLILGLHHAIFLALGTGFLEIVPLAGPVVSATLAGLVAVESARGLGGIIAYTIYAVVLRLSIDEFVGPLVLGRAARLHPALVIFCFLAGAMLFGISGVVLAVPIALAIKATLLAVYENEGVQTAQSRGAEQDA